MQRGQILTGRYRLEEPLGHGGMGAVWQAADQRLRRPVAIKILTLPAIVETAEVNRFRREAEIAATLNHPGITTVHDVDEHRDGDKRWLFLVMELMVGRDLRHLLAAKPAGLPIGQIHDLSVQITDALGAAHRRGVIHRDIKPANLFLLQDGRVKICDFGIARLADATKITTTGTVPGTPLYMAPEQIQAGHVDHRTDLYAFGCVLYELLTGTTWISPDANIGAVIYQHLNQPPTPPKSTRPDTPDHLNTLVIDLLAKQPDDRPGNAQAVTERLHEPAGKPPAPQPMPPLPADNKPEPGPPHIRRRTVVLGSLSAATLVGVPTAWLLLEPGSKSESKVTPRPTPKVRLESVLDHVDAVYTATFSPDGKTLATTSRDSTARLWDVATRRTTAILTGHTDAVFSAAFSPDGKTLATSGGDKTVRLWDVATQRTTATLTGHTDSVDAVAFSPDGKTLASAGRDKTVRLWDVATGRAIDTLIGHTDAVYSVAFSPDGKTLATAGRDAIGHLWDLAARRTTATLAEAVYSVAFSPDGKTLAAADSDTTARLWEVSTPSTIATLTGHTDYVNSVAFSPDGKTLATASDDKTARLWRIN